MVEVWVDVDVGVDVEVRSKLYKQFFSFAVGWMT